MNTSVINEPQLLVTVSDVTTQHPYRKLHKKIYLTKVGGFFNFL